MKKEQKWDLQRFIEAQERTYQTALSEIRNGYKASCWMWYIFPNIKGLGQSSTARFYAISCAEEARAYIEHPVLGRRLREICMALLDVPSNDPTEVMGYIDDYKLKSCMTLFSVVAPEYPIFRVVLNKYFHGERDEETLRLLNYVEVRKGRLRGECRWISD